MILESFSVFALAWAAGIGVAHVIWSSRDPWSILLKVFLGLGLGLGITSCLYFLRLVLIPGQGGYLLIQAVLLSTTITALYFKNRLSFISFPRSISVTRNQILLSLAAGLVFAFALQYSLVAARVSPHGDYDAQAIWNLRARFMYRLGDDWRNAFSPNINRDFHMDYPLLIPMNVVGGWNALRDEVVRVPAVQSILFLLGLAGLLYAVLGYLRSASQAALGVIVALATPSLLQISTFQTADIPLAYFFLASSMLFLLARREGSGDLLFLCGLMAGLSAWTKNEGLSFGLIMVIVTLAAFPQSLKRSMLFRLAGGMALPLLTLLVFKVLFPATNDLLADINLLSIARKLFDTTRYGTILTYLKSELAILGGWPFSILILLAAYGIVMGRSNSRRSQIGPWLFVIVGAQFLAYLLVYLATPNDLVWQIRYSLSRLLIHLFPMGVLLFFLSVRAPENIDLASFPASGNQP